MGARLPTTPEHRPDRCFLPDLAELGPHRRIGPDSHAGVTKPSYRKVSVFSIRQWGVNYSGNEVKTWVKRTFVKSFVLAIKIRFWVIYSSFPGVPGKTDAPVAQLDRATDYGSVGWGFESLQAHHFFEE